MAPVENPHSSQGEPRIGLKDIPKEDQNLLRAYAQQVEETDWQQRLSQFPEREYPNPKRRVTLVRNEIFAHQEEFIDAIGEGWVSLSSQVPTLDTLLDQLSPEDWEIYGSYADDWMVLMHRASAAYRARVQERPYVAQEATEKVIETEKAALINQLRHPQQPEKWKMSRRGRLALFYGTQYLADVVRARSKHVPASNHPHQFYVGKIEEAAGSLFVILQESHPPIIPAGREATDTRFSVPKAYLPGMNYAGDPDSMTRSQTRGRSLRGRFSRQPDRTKKK